MVTKQCLDPQRDRVYGWEAQWADWNSQAISLGKAREYVHWACGLYGLCPPSVKRHRTNEYSYSQGTLISFHPAQVNRGIALHEASHFICDEVFGPDMAHHCPQWMGIYLWLLVTARIAPPVALFASARAAGIKWCPMWTVSPKRLARSAGVHLTKRQLCAPSR